jgi:hypothetical protein
MGRPSKKDQPTGETVSEKFLSAVRLGLSEKTASELCGVDESTANRWKTDPIFASAIQKARAEGKEWWCDKLRRSAEVAAERGNPTPMIFWLSRRTEEFKEDKTIEIPAGKRLIIEDCD